MNYNFQKNGFLKNENIEKNTVKFNSIRKTPEQIKVEMIKLKNNNGHIVSNVSKNDKPVEQENYYKSRIDAIKNIRKK
ncbi:MAG: hypothetical protein IJ134_05430 [Bacilli bacterium]|nr:hypothetical protein [Bacilli bacterium]